MVQASIMMLQPRIPQDHRNTWRLQDVELVLLAMTACGACGLEKSDDGPQRMAAQGVHCDQTGDQTKNHAALLRKCLEGGTGVCLSHLAIPQRRALLIR